MLESGSQNGFLIVPTEHRRHRTDEPWQGHCYSGPLKIATDKYIEGTSVRIHWEKKAGNPLGSDGVRSLNEYARNA